MAESNPWLKLQGKVALNFNHAMTNANIKRVKSSEIEFKDRLVSIQRVTKVTKGGRTFSFSAIVVVGNENGVVGYGLGKAKEVTAAIAKGVDDAKKNLIKVPLSKTTIPHEQLGKYGGALIFIKPAAPGTGVIAGGAMRAVLESVGIKDVLAKSKGSSNPHSVVKATIDALVQLRDPYAVAQLRGITLNQVFNG
jgi:small subunit ribosomal protein S5